MDYLLYKYIQVTMKQTYSYNERGATFSRSESKQCYEGTEVRNAHGLILDDYIAAKRSFVVHMYECSIT